MVSGRQDILAIDAPSKTDGCCQVGARDSSGLAIAKDASVYQWYKKSCTSTDHFWNPITQIFNDFNSYITSKCI